MAAPLRPIGEGVLRRERRRVRWPSLDADKRQKLAARVCEQYSRDLQSRSTETDLRLQRYAKYRLWTSPDTGWPWPGSSNQAVPDLLEASTRMQDVLHNAVMSARPIVVSRALQKDNVEKERAIDALHDTQLFVEQNGERIVEQAAESFCNDPSMTLYAAWITERREVVDVRTFPAIPDSTVPAAYFGDILGQAYPGWNHISYGEGWDWEVSKASGSPDDRGESWTIAFYTKASGDVEMVVRGTPIVFDGPLVRVISYDDVICPPSVANLDIPSPSNPGGAAHVILRDYPTKDEIKRLAKRSGNAAPFYDMLGGDAAELAKISAASRAFDYQEGEDQRSLIAGEEQNFRGRDESQNTLTRLVCFDTVDVDGDGQTEDVVLWVIYETRQLLRVRYLTEFFPGNRPERPLASASFLPVGGRRAGMSLLETAEGLHDWMKETVDQMVDNGTLANLPWFTYRASSSVKPEMLRPGPGDGVPLGDPRNDLVVQQFRNDGGAFWLNLLTLIRREAERVTMQGELQAGRVPAGASSALRTLGGIQTLLSQGEARPERILRRFFMALTRTFRQMHRLNRYFLTDEKKFRAAPTILRPGEDPYFVVATADVDLELEFDFHANVMNSSKQALQQGLQVLMSTYISQIGLSLGLVTKENAYHLFRDFGRAFGQEVDAYLTPPQPDSDDPKITAPEAVLTLSRGIMPDGQPLEGAVRHLEELQEILQWDSFGGFPPQYIPLLQNYVVQVTRQAAAESQLAQQAAAAGGMGQMPGEVPGQPGRPPEQPVQAPTQAPVQNNEMMDETMPMGGGGAMGGPMGGA